MIHLQLAGRLGNNLFQWATALNIQSEELRVKLIYDDFHQSQPSDLFRKIVGETIEIKKSNLAGRLFQVEDKYFSELPILKRLIYSDKNPFAVYETHGRKIKFARGYFQSWRNFVNIEEMIANQLQTAVDDWIDTSESLSKIRLEIGEFIAVHVRQGDYVGSDFGTLSTDYYRNNKVESSIPVVVFTDQDKLKAKYKEAIKPDFIFTPEKLSADDSFALMAQARSIVLANSTYSWWAGYLIGRRDGQVVIPFPWTKKTTFGEEMIHPRMHSKKALFN